MKTMILISAAGILLSNLDPQPSAASVTNSTVADAQSAPVPLDQIGARATAQYTGEGLAVTATAQGARLRCAFQKMDGEVTSEGIWLASTAPGAEGGRFRVVATALGGSPLPAKGKVEVMAAVARFIRPLVTEEYSVSVDGVRQDFIVQRRPDGASALRVELGLTGARAEAASYGAKLTLDGSGKALAYSRLRALDAQGKELTASMEVVGNQCLAVVVEDAGAAYPVRIDPTFSDANWVNTIGHSLPGANNAVWAMVLDASGNLYAGGDFTAIGTVLANRIAKWDGTAWSALGSGMNQTVCSLVISDTNLYAGGYFTTAGGGSAKNVARWDGSSWSALGSGTDGGVLGLAVSGTNLYAGGNFYLADGGLVNHIAKWNGSSWSALGTGMNYGVNAVAVIGTTLYAGGAFTTAGGSGISYIAKWNGSSWSGLGSGTSSTVWALTAAGTNLYVGGAFTTAGGVTAMGIAKWNGTSWSALGAGFPNTVRAVAVSGTDVYAGGHFPNVYGGVTVNYIAKWNGSSWSALGSGMSDSVWTLAVSGTTLYAGGNFMMAGSGAGKCIAKWNGAWSALGSGINQTVQTLALSGTDLYAGGAFIRAGETTANHVAKWNGSAWSALGSGMNTNVYALTFLGTNLYAGGAFTSAGGVSANYVAKWNGSAWSALGSGVNNQVCALAVLDTNLYVGGYFTTAGSSAAKYLAKWDGSSWSPVGSGMNSNVLALTVSGSDLYAGGSFTNAGGSAANYIAKWDGSSWLGLGSGVSYDVLALAVLGADLYAGGKFGAVGGKLFGFIAKWNGSSWSALGSGMSGGYVYALAASGTDLYVGGDFTSAGGTTANRIAKWDGSSWSGLGSGMNYGVQALALSGTNLYAGGNFTIAGTNVGGYIVQGSVTPSQAGIKPAITIQPTNVTAVKGSSAGLYVSATGTDPLSYQWYFNGNQPVPGATSNLLSWPCVDPTNAGDYSIIVTNLFGADTSQVATLTVLVPPQFTLHPSNLTVTVGAPAQMTARADGTPAPQYQWYFNGAPLADATTTAMGFSSAQSSNAGPYFVIATNAAGSATSEVATLCVNLAIPDAFNPGPDLYANCMAVQEDGKVVIGGIFSTVQGAARPALARVNADGAIDLGFNAQTTGTVYAVAIQTDGKILAGGNFIAGAASGLTWTNLARFNDDGSPDESFAPPLLSTVGSLLVQPDSNIVVGTFTAGVSGSCLSRLGPNGSVDPDFAPVVDNISSMAMQPDGKIVVGGKFTTLCGQPRAYLGRLKADGTLDDDFLATAVTDDWVVCLALQEDGKLLVGGSFTNLAGGTRHGLGRLNSNGSLDTDFADPQIGHGTVYSLAAQTDGKILVGGWFSTVGRAPRANVCRLNSDGTLDLDFCPAADDQVYGLGLQPDGRILLAGAFNTVAGHSRTNIARLNNTEPATQTLSYASPVITWLRGGTSPEVWRTSFEVSTDFVIWTNLGAGTKIPGGWAFSGFPLAPNTVIRARGFDAGGLHNSATWYVQSLLSLDRTAPLLPADNGSVGMVANTTGTNRFGFQFKLQYGQIGIIEGSATADSGGWVPLATYQCLDPLGAPIRFVDPEPATWPGRWYRVRLQ